MKPNYYNEIDPIAANWLRELISAGHIAPGIVDERSIEDVQPDELNQYTQCHFFAGIGVWSYALRQAGWPDDRPVWTGSCPCQPFSAAGKGDGFADERHLWPAFNHLIAQCRPAVVFGEQVASKAVDPWIDLVHADLEAVGYTFGSVPFPSAGVGAPHIRDRNYWVADANSQQRYGSRERRQGWGAEHPNSRTAVGLGNSNIEGSQGLTGHGGAEGRSGQTRPAASTGLYVGLADTQQHVCGPQASTADHWQSKAYGPADRAGGRGSSPGGLGNTHSESTGWYPGGPHAAQIEYGAEGGDGDRSGNAGDLLVTARSTGPVNGRWRDADWLFCRDGRWRPVESGTFPLAHGLTARVGRLRGYGNAINAKAAQAFVEAYLETQQTETE